MTNLILFYCDRMYGFFGLGSHIRELSRFLKQQPDLRITLVLTETEKYREVTFRQEEGFDLLYIPCPGNGLFLNSEDNLIAKTLARRVLQIAYPYLAPLENKVCWFNSLAELNIADQVRNYLHCRIMYVHHGWAWKDHLNVEDEVFSHYWSLRDPSVCPTAFEDTALQLRMVACSDRTITITQQAYNMFVQAFGIEAEKLTTIYNGMEIPSVVGSDRSFARKQLCIDEHEKIVLYSGRISSSKGVGFLTRAFGILLQQIPNCRLVLLGTGDYEEVIRAAAPFWNKITFTGNISRDDIRTWYQAADIGVIPSLMEQCSYTAIEMRFWRLPVIVTAVDGLEELFVHGQDAWKIPISHHQDGTREIIPEDLREAMYRLLTDPPLQEQLAANGYQKAIQHFTLATMGAAYYRVIRELTASAIVST